MIGVVGQGNMGGPYQGLVDPPAAPTDAHSASNGNLGDKATLGFVPSFSLNSCSVSGLLLFIDQLVYSMQVFYPYCILVTNILTKMTSYAIL